MAALERNLTKIYIAHTAIGFSLIAPVFVLYFQESGLSLQEIFILESVNAFAILLFEVPTGFLSDKIGRKKTLLLSIISVEIAFIIYIFKRDFVSFLIADIFYALALALYSGTFSALVYETLKEQKREDEYKRVWGSIIFYTLLGASLASLLSGFLATISLRLPFIVNFFTYIVALVAILFLDEPRVKRVANSKQDIISAIEKTFFNGSILKWVVLFSSAIYMFAQGAFYFYQPYLKLSGIDLVYFGMIFASFNIIASLGSKYAYKIEKKLGVFGSFLLICLFVGGSLVAMGLYVGAFSVIFIYAQQFVRIFKGILVEDLINKETVSEYRATMLSLESLVRKLLIATVLPIFGYFGDLIGVEATLLFMGIGVFIVTLPIIFIIKSKIEQNQIKIG